MKMLQPVKETAPSILCAWCINISYDGTTRCSIRGEEFKRVKMCWTEFSDEGTIKMVFFFVSRRRVKQVLERNRVPTIHIRTLQSYSHSKELMHNFSNSKDVHLMFQQKSNAYNCEIFMSGRRTASHRTNHNLSKLHLQMIEAMRHERPRIRSLVGHCLVWRGKSKI